MSRRSHRDRVRGGAPRRCRMAASRVLPRAGTPYRFALDSPAPLPLQVGYVNPELPFWVQQECRLYAGIAARGPAGRAFIWLVLAWLLVPGLALLLP